MTFAIQSTYKESRVLSTQRARRSGLCRLYGGLDKARHIVQTALLVRVQRSVKGLYKTVEGPKHKTFSPLDDLLSSTVVVEGV